MQGQSTERALRDRASAKDCNACPLKAKCTTGKQGRSLCRSVDEEYLDRVRGYYATEAYKKAYRKRSVWLEPLFAEGKQWHGMRRFRLRRLWRGNCEALVIAAGQNLKRLLQKRGWGRRPFPTEAMDASFLCFYVFCSPLCRRISHKRLVAVVYEKVFFKGSVCSFADLLSFSTILKQRLSY